MVCARCFPFVLLPLAFAAATGCGATPREVSEAPNGRASASSSGAASGAPESVTPKTVTPPTPLSREARLLAKLSQVAGKPGRSLLILGLHDEPVETFAWLFGSGDEPPGDPAPAYRTLVVDVRDGDVTLALELPFLVLPDPRGFVFLGEANAAAFEEIPARGPGLEVDGLGDPIPHHYARTELWETRVRGDVVREPKERAARIARRRAWGETSADTLLVATPEARCTLSSWSSWTGGALAFRGGNDVRLAVSKTPAATPQLASFVDDAELARVTRRIERVGEEAVAVDDSTPIDLDATRSLGLGQEYVPRKDIRACLQRHAGRVALTGAATIYGNSARSFDHVIVSQPAPASLVGNPASLPFDLAAWTATVPGLFDAVASPSGDVIGLLREEGLFFYSGVSHTRLFEVPVTADARVVVAEWARDDEADRWLDELSKPWPKGVDEATRAQQARAVASRKAAAEAARSRDTKGATSGEATPRATSE